MVNGRPDNMTHAGRIIWHRWPFWMTICNSLVETAKLNNLNIYAYLETVLLYMPDYKNEPEGIEELMPWSDMIQQSCQIKNKH